MNGIRLNSPSKIENELQYYCEQCNVTTKEQRRTEETENLR